MRGLRLVLATASFVALTLLFLDGTGYAVAHWGWLAKVQFLPALLSLSAFTWMALAVVLGILAVTFLFGRVYCSVICPLGIFQDGVAWIVRLVWRRPHSYAPAHTRMRVAFLVATLGAGVAGLHFAFLAPYGIYGRAVAAFLTPLARLGCNALVPWLQAHGCYLVRSVEIVVPTAATLICAGALLVAVALCAAVKGRLWCNAVCPVGTLLGCVSRHARVKPVLDAAKCVNCGLCARVCKAQCIDVAAHQVDTSRCVVCFNCSSVCGKGALKWK